MIQLSIKLKSAGVISKLLNTSPLPINTSPAKRMQSSDTPSDPIASTSSNYNFEMESMESSTEEELDASVTEDTTATSALERGAQNDQLLEKLE